MAYSRSGASSISLLFGFFVVWQASLSFFAVADEVEAGGSNLCGADLSTFLPPPYSNMSNMICSPVWNTFAVRYTQNKDNVLTIILSAVYTTGWVGIGFSRDGMMVGSSAIVGWFNKQGHARIKQYYLQGTKTTQVIPDKGELPLTKIPSAVALHGATMYMAFQIKPEDRLTHQPILLAFGSGYPVHNRLTHHDDKTTILFDFSAGSVSTGSNGVVELKKNHGILGIVGWGLFLPCGAIVARYFRHKDPLWFYLHISIQFVGFIFGLATVVAGTQLYNKIHAHVRTHRGIGIFVLTLSILQVMAFFLRPNHEAKTRKYWNWYHHWVGRIALFLGALNIVLGIQIGNAGNSWKISYGFLLGAVLISVFALEALLFMRKSEKLNENPAFQMNPVM